VAGKDAEPVCTQQKFLETFFSEMRDDATSENKFNRVTSQMITKNKIVEICRSLFDHFRLEYPTGTI
jgi:hypothetical protein